MASYVAGIEQEYQGQLVVNVIGFARTDTLGAETPAEAAIVAEQVAIAWKARIIPRQVNTLKFLQVVARGVNNAGIVGTSIALPVNGSLVQAGLPGFAAARVQLQTQTPRRAGRGRTGLCGVSESDTDSATPNNLSAAAQTAFSNNFVNFVNDLAALAPTIFPVVFSRVLNLVPRAAPLVSQVTSTSVMIPLGTRVSRIR